MTRDAESDGSADSQSSRAGAAERVDPSGGDGPVDVDRFAVTADADRVEFLAAAKLYAREVVAAADLAVDVSALEWSVSERAKRRAGAVIHREGEPREVRLTWAHFAECGWRAAAATVRHELVHVHRLNEAGDPGHGGAFRRLADRLDAPLHCERFAEPAYWVVCEECDCRLARYRRSKLVANPERYRCGECGGEFVVESVE